MTKEDRIKWNLGQIAGASGRKWGSGMQAQVKFIRRRLERIEYLLEPEQESLASSVLRLTNICNDLERENATLRDDLADMTLSFKAAKKYASALKADLDNKSRLYLEEAEHARLLTEELDVTISSNIWLRERLSFKDESLRAYRTTEGVLKAEVARQDELLKEAEQRIKSLQATCSKVMTDAGVMELRASNTGLLRRNRQLERDLNLADTHIEELQKDLTTLSRQDWRRGK